MGVVCLDEILVSVYQSRDLLDSGGFAPGAFEVSLKFLSIHGCFLPGPPDYDAGTLLVLGGALSFYFSDIFVARDRFLKNQFLNRLIGLPLYYLGQFLLAFSIGVII